MAESAFDEEFLERFVATPFTSLSVSSVGSRDTNSFCSNCTTAYGLARDERTLSPRAWMSLTCICPLDGPAVAVPFAECCPDEDDELDPFDEVEADLEMPEGCNLLVCCFF